METPRILHFLTPLPNPSPFDVNMAYDSDFAVAGYTGVELKDVTGLTQDAMFSRAPQDAPKTLLFIGGRDAMLALDMAAAARKAMFPPFEVSVFVDPSGAFTTAAAMIAVVDKYLGQLGTKLDGAKVAVFGAKGVVGGVAGLIAAEAGADVALVAHDRSDAVQRKAEDFERRFSRRFRVIDGSTDEGRRAALQDAEIVLACARAGVQAVSHDDLKAAKRLKVAADVNAVPPSGIEGLDVKADGKSMPESEALGIGALAIGNVKFRLQRDLLKTLHDSGKALVINYHEAYVRARELVT